MVLIIVVLFGSTPMAEVDAERHIVERNASTGSSAAARADG